MGASAVHVCAYMAVVFEVAGVYSLGNNHPSQIHTINPVVQRSSTSRLNSMQRV